MEVLDVTVGAQAQQFQAPKNGSSYSFHLKYDCFSHTHLVILFPLWTMYCPSLIASPTSFMEPVLLPPVKIRALVDLAAEIKPLNIINTTWNMCSTTSKVFLPYTCLNVSFFFPSILKFFAPPINDNAK